MCKRFALMMVLLAAALAPALDAVAVPISKCALLERKSIGPDVLVNRCKECMQVKVERRRPSSNTVPTLRDYTLPAGARQTLPFRGPGSTRVINEYACRGTLPQKEIPQKKF